MNKKTELGNVKWVVLLSILSSIFGIVTFLSGKNFPDLFYIPPTSTDNPITVSFTPTHQIFPTIDTLLPYFEDDFENGLKSEWLGDIDNWFYNDGKVVIKDGYRAIIVTGEMDWVDYTVEVSAQSDMPINSTYIAGVVVRYQDYNNYLAFVLDCDNNGSVYWLFKKDGQIDNMIFDMTRKDYLSSLCRAMLNLFADIFMVWEKEMVSGCVFAD